MVLGMDYNGWHAVATLALFASTGHEIVPRHHWDRVVSAILEHTAP